MREHYGEEETKYSPADFSLGLPDRHRRAVRLCSGLFLWTDESTTIEGGDAVLLDGLSYKLGNPKRNDVIAFQLNGNREGASSIKRILGVPGETIQIKDGMIYIDGEIYLEKKDYPAMTDAGLAEEPITLGTNQYFVLGDNRNNSEDSRYADVGVVSGKNIEGKVWFVLSPSDHMGLVK